VLVNYQPNAMLEKYHESSDLHIKASSELKEAFCSQSLTITYFLVT